MTGKEYLPYFDRKAEHTAYKQDQQDPSGSRSVYWIQETIEKHAKGNKKSNILREVLRPQALISQKLREKPCDRFSRGPGNIKRVKSCY
jgi:hypothetical protein